MKCRSVFTAMALLGGLSSCSTLIAGYHGRAPTPVDSGLHEEKDTVSIRRGIPIATFADRQTAEEKELLELLPEYEEAITDFESALKIADSKNLIKDAHVFLVSLEQINFAEQEVKSCSERPLNAKAKTCAYFKKNLEIAQNLVVSMKARLGPELAKQLAENRDSQEDIRARIRELSEKLAVTGISAEFAEKIGLTRILDSYHPTSLKELETVYLEWTMLQQAALESGKMPKSDKILISRFGFTLVSEVVWNNALRRNRRLNRRELSLEGQKRAQYLDKRGLESFGAPLMAAYEADVRSILQERFDSVNPRNKS